MPTSATSPPAKSVVVALFAAAVLLGVMLARIAVPIQMHWSPVLVFPLLMGAISGAAVAALIKVWPDLRRRAVLMAAALAGLTFFGGQHFFAHRQYLANYETTRLKNPPLQLLEQALADLKPMPLADFLHYSARERFYGPLQLHGAGVWMSWAFDGLLTVAAAVAAAWYCSCQWPARRTSPSADDPAPPPLQ